MIGTRRIACLAWLLAGTWAGMTTAAAQGPLVNNEAELEAVMHPSTLKVDDPVAVFDFVLNSLPDRVKVLPNENYYYFRFVHNGVNYTGNIRLAVISRDQGKFISCMAGNPPTGRASSASIRSWWTRSATSKWRSSPASLIAFRMAARA